MNIFIFMTSYLGLFIMWGFIVNSLLVPWDGVSSQDRPPLGSTSYNINNYFETSSFGSYIPLMVLFVISLLIILLRIKKEGVTHTLEILEHTAVTNFLYIGLLVTLFFAYSWLVPPQAETSYNTGAIIIQLVGIVVLFGVQYTSHTLHKKS
jgi:hypothetical protein